MELQLVENKIAAIENFPAELAMLVKHLLVSHHGAYEFGSPKLPQTLEAVILHSLDDLDGKRPGDSKFAGKRAGIEVNSFSSRLRPQLLPAEFRSREQRRVTAFSSEE